jgi:MATE family multidrug resistance protein
MGLCFQVSAWMYMTASGIGSGVNTRVGNELGAGQGAAARLACLTALLAVAVTQSSAAVGAWLLRHQLLAVFTSSGEVQAAALRVMPVLMFSLLTDGLNAVFGGVLRGAGKQKMGAALNLVGYWLVAMPLALLLGFRAGLGAVGFWVGLLLGSFVQNLVQLVYVLRLDWHWEAACARDEALEEMAGCQEFVARARWDVDSEDPCTPVSNRALSEHAEKAPLLLAGGQAAGQQQQHRLSRLSSSGAGAGAGAGAVDQQQL